MEQHRLSWRQRQRHHFAPGTVGCLQIAALVAASWFVVVVIVAVILARLGVWQ